MHLHIYVSQRVTKKLMPVRIVARFSDNKVEQPGNLAQSLQGMTDSELLSHPAINFTVVRAIESGGEIIKAKTLNNMIGGHPAAAYGIANTFTGERIDERPGVTDEEKPIAREFSPYRPERQAMPPHLFQGACRYEPLAKKRFGLQHLLKRTA